MRAVASGSCGGYRRDEVRDRRYSSAGWQKLRRFVIARDGGLCQVQGPRCAIVATTAHHRLPSSQYPELFWDPANLEASCTPCNHHGAQVKAENRANRQTIARLERELADAHARIAELEAEPERKPARPAIY
jgi:5-methylcytosine-specific restriction endonuclease McrA